MHRVGKTFVKTTKRGQAVTKVRRERYLRDDVYVGCGDAAVEARYRGRDEALYVLRPERRGAKSERTIALIDSNVALHQMDALADARVTDVVICATVMEETRNKSRTSYERLRGLCKDKEKRFYVFSNENHAETYAEDVAGESANDRNDRAIRKAAAFYRRAIPRAACERVTLVTNDRGNARKAREENIDVMSVIEWIQSISNDASLVDLVVPGGGAEIPEDERDAKRAKSGGGASASVFEAYLDANDIKEGLASGKLIKGGVRTSRYNPFEAHVMNEGTGEGVLLSGRAAMNRAIDGDLVAVEILPESQWIRPGGMIITGTAEEDKETSSADVDAKDDAGGLAPETADETDVAVAATKASGVVPTGKVVGIIRRNWRERGYAASVDMGRGRFRYLSCRGR